MNINEIKLNDEWIIYTIDNKDYIVKLPVKAIEFINKYHIWLYDLATTATIESKEKHLNNSIEFKEFFKYVFNKELYKTIRQVFYKHSIFKFNEYEFRNRIVNILKEQTPTLDIYYLLLNDFPTYWYIKHWYEIYWSFNGTTKIFKYKWTAIIEDLKTWKRDFQQIDYYNPKNWFNFKYYINSKNEVKYSYEEMIEELKQEFNIS